MLKSERKYSYHIYWSLWRQLGLRKSLWVICKILGLFVNPLTADNKYSLLNRNNLLQHLQMQLSQKKSFSHFFGHFQNLKLILHIFKKRWLSLLLYFSTYGLLKMWWDKRLKNSVSQDPPTINMVNGTKHCWILKDGTFTMVIHHFDCNSVGQNVSEWYANSEDYLLTHWLPMTSILFLTESNYCNIFRCSYLRNLKYFLKFFFVF